MPLMQRPVEKTMKKILFPIFGPLLALSLAFATPGHAGEIAVKADEFLSYHLLDIGDVLRVELAGGREVRIEVVDRGTDVYEDFGHKQWTLWAVLEVDGHPIRLLYSPFRMKAMYEPTVVNGVRMGLDGVKGLATATGVGGAGSEAEPSGDVRIWVQDATTPLMPNCHIWFTLPQDRDVPGWPRRDDYRIRQDRDIHPNGGNLDSTYHNELNPDEPTYKTGWLGAWPYDGPAFHNGLDIQLEVGTDLYSVIDSCTQGSMESSWHGIAYTHYRANGDRWSFTNLHCSNSAADQGATLTSGDKSAISGTYRAGIAHAHTYIRYRPSGERSIRVNSWPVIWQGIENRKAQDGFIRARIDPVPPANPGEEVVFDGSASTPEKGWGKLTYKWFFDDGTTSAEPVARKTFDQPGMHQALLLVDDGRLEDIAEVYFTVGGSDSSQCPQITREIIATSSSSPFPMLPEVGTEVSYQVSALSPDGNTLQYNWDFGDGTAAGQSVKHTVSSAGRHIAVVTVTDVAVGLRCMDWYVLDTYEWPDNTPPERRLGDANSDGELNISDLLAVLWAIRAPAPSAACDVDRDGDVDILDVLKTLLLIKRSLVLAT